MPYDNPTPRRFFVVVASTPDTAWPLEFEPDTLARAKASVRHMRRGDPFGKFIIATWAPTPRQFVDRLTGDYYTPVRGPYTQAAFDAFMASRPATVRG